MPAGTRRRTLRIGVVLAMLAGLGAVLTITAIQGFAEVGAVMLAAGWGIALVAAFHLIPTAAAAVAWHVIAGALAADAKLAAFFWARLLREAVNGLLPVAQIGGNIVGARVLTFHGVRPLAAGASVVADVTVEVFAQIVFTAIGLAVLVALGGGGLAIWASAGLGVGIVAGVGFLLAQRWGMFLVLERLLDRIAHHLAWPELGGLANLHETLMAIYRNGRVMTSTALWHLGTWFLDAAELWLVLWVVGANLSFAEALVIESLAQAIRSAAFMVPGAFGIQEAGYIVLGMHFGLAPEVALSVSLVKRLRDLVLGVPMILFWQFIEGRRLLSAQGPADQSGTGDRS